MGKMNACSSLSVPELRLQSHGLVVLKLQVRAQVVGKAFVSTRCRREQLKEQPELSATA